MAYLTKRGKRYIYRRRLPLDLAFAHHTDQIRVSLRTNSRREAERIADKFNEKLDRAFTDIRLSKLTWSEARALVAAAVELGGVTKGEPTLKALATEYEQSKGQGWNAKGKQEYWKAFALVEEAIGDRVVRLVDRALVLKVRDHILARNVAPRTVNKYLQRLSSLLTYAVATGIIQANPCVQVKFAISKKTINENRYKPYSDDDIKYILEEMLVKPGGYRYCTYMYWLPLLGAFTGARSGDLADLTKEDFIERGEIKCVLIGNHKTGAMPRPVPLHSRLLSLGILDFVDSLESEAKLFKIPSHGDERGYNYKWYMRRLREKITDENKAFHSWRATIATRLNDAEVSVTHRADLLGHERRSDTETDKTYTSITQIKTLKTAIEKLEYNIDWDKVKIN